MKRIPTKDFPNDRKTLIFMIRWLLNEMEWTHHLLNENNIEEAKSILSKEFQDNTWLELKDRRSLVE